MKAETMPASIVLLPVQQNQVETEFFILHPSSFILCLRELFGGVLRLNGYRFAKNFMTV